MTNRDQDGAAGQSTLRTGASGGNEVVIISPKPGEEKRAKAFVESSYGVLNFLESVVTCYPVAMEDRNLAAQAVEVGTAKEEEDLLIGAQASKCGPAYDLQLFRRLMVAYDLPLVPPFMCTNA
ncbi:unnamed protein product [Pocillopora meandrina]|uniref:Uncharacterized protein n=1 Tax=Pocillopora meandrina TaxID=46732 RepID=A0AAU9WB42_9CNID|nr:unnamed protein product [Pocillopora meandrina]